VQLCRLLFFAFLFAFANTAQAATVLVLQFHNNSEYSDLNWVGESIAETLRSELSAANEIVPMRDSLAEGLRRLSLRPDAAFTKATLIRLGQTVDVDFVCYGSYDIKLPSPDAALKDSSIQLTARFIDLRRMHDGPELSETGKLAELSRFEEYLAFQSLKYLEPQGNFQLDQFLAPAKLIRLDAQESYVRGLLSSSPEQQQKWFTQAVALDSKFISPEFELGKLALARKDYAQAISWFQRIPAGTPDYTDARFRLGIAQYGAGNYTDAANDFREVAKMFPLSEVFNNLGAAENQLNLPVALDDFRRALDADPNDPVYLFNLGSALLKNGYFDEAAKMLNRVLAQNPDDAETNSLLERAQKHEAAPSGEKLKTPNRLKQSLNETAFRQLKAMLQPKTSH